MPEKKHDTTIIEPENRDALEAKVTAALNDLDDADDAEVTDDAADPEEAVTDDADESEDADADAADAGDDDADDADDDDADEDSSAEDDEADAEAGAAADGEEPDAPTLPDAHRRSLIAYGWTDEDIDTNLKNLGERFLTTAAKLHENRNTETARQAEIGRKLIEDQKRQAGEQTPEKGRLDPIDVAALKKKFGDDELIDAIVGPVNERMEYLNKVLPQVQSARDMQQQQELDALAKQVDDFFASETVKPYTDLYGTASNRTKDQTEFRNKLLETADALTAGAKYQGRTLSVQEALEAAHGLVSADYQQTAARKSVKKAAKQRNKGISLKPTRATSGATGTRRTKANQAPSREELEARTAKRLKALSF